MNNDENAVNESQAGATAKPAFFDINDIASDMDAELNGRWCPLPNGASVKVARINNENFNNFIRRRFKANRVMLEQDDDLAAKISEKLMIEAYAHTILKDVKGIGMNGVLIEAYTPEIGVQLLNSRNFREKIKAYAEDQEGFLLKREEAAVNV